MLSTLIVEDNATYRQSLHHLLEKRFPSMEIAEAADGEDALHQALSRRFDLIFMDIRLPHGNGISLTKTIKTVFVDSLICIITNHSIVEYREAAFQNGADHFIVKGESTEAEIGDLVESWLRTRFISLIIVSDSLSR
jgi:DNA-binding NarL/FixJ family response regulator